MSAPLSPEQRETLRELLAGHENGLRAYGRTSPVHLVSGAERIIDALRAALVERNCGTCAHWRRGGRGGVFPLSCVIRVGRWAADDSCNLYDARTARPSQTETTP